MNWEVSQYLEREWAKEGMKRSIDHVWAFEGTRDIFRTMALYGQRSTGGSALARFIKSFRLTTWEDPQSRED